MKRIIGAFGLVLALASGAAAQEFPSRQITIVVPYPAGGALDAVGRVVAEQLRQTFKQTVVVENRVGGNSLVGTLAVARARPDGYTLLVTSETGQAVLPAIDPNFTLDPLSEFQPLSLIAKFPHLLVARKSLGVNSVQELIAYAKQNPGKLNYGSTGIGAISHVAMEVFKRRTQIDMVHVPYRGSAAALTDLMGGSVDFNVQSLPVLQSQLENPNLKILAVLSPERDKRLPSIPTMIESGVPNFSFVSWTAIVGPKGIPAPIISRLSEALAAATRAPPVAEKLRSIGFEAVGSNAKELDDQQREVARTWKEIAQETGIRVGK